MNANEPDPPQSNETTDASRALSVAEVNARLPLVTSIVDDIVTGWAELQETREQLLSFRSRRTSPPPGPAGTSSAPRPVAASATYPTSGELQATVDRLKQQKKRQLEEVGRFAEELRRLGGILHDPTQGWVDFLNQNEGELRLLCWRPGEEQIKFWRPLAGSATERYPLPGLPNTPCVPGEEVAQ